MKARELTKGLNFIEMFASGDLEVTGITMDSRNVKPGYAFICCKGANVDSHQFIAQALQAGAVLIVGTDREALTAAGSWVLVKDSRLAAAWLANRFHRSPGRRLQVVGITGTNGKTSVTYIVEWLLQACGLNVGVISTVEARWCGNVRKLSHTTPEAPEFFELLGEMADSGVEVAVVEVSSHGIDMKRVEYLDFGIGVFTNLSQDHLDYHGTLEAYREVKTSMFTRLLPASAVLIGAVVNVDDPVGSEIASQVGYKVVRFSLEGREEVHAENVRILPTGVEFDAVGKWGRVAVRSGLIGRHNIYNLLAGLSVVHLLGVDVPTAAAAITEIPPIPGRLEPIDNALGISCFVDYCHTPAALENVLSALQDITKRGVITVFGAGGDRDRGKRPKMAQVVERLSQRAIVTTDNPRREDPKAIVTQILAGFSSGYREKNVTVCLDRRKGIEMALRQALPGDVVLIGGKGHETYQIIGSQVHHFDDREVAREVFHALEEERGCI